MEVRLRPAGVRRHVAAEEPELPARHAAGRHEGHRVRRRLQVRRAGRPVRPADAFAFGTGS